MKSDKWYYRGREAAGHRQPRELWDGRLSAESRAEWFRGYDDEARTRVQATAEQRAEASRVIGRLKEWSQATLGGNS